MVLGRLGLAATYSLTDADADAFFEASSVAASTGPDGVTVLTASTPLATACGAAVLEEDTEEYGLHFSSSMDPGTPSLDHEVSLGTVVDGSVRLFAFLPFGRGIYVSATYELQGGAFSKTGSNAFASAPSDDDVLDSAVLSVDASSTAFALSLDASSSVAAVFSSGDFDGLDSDGPTHGVARADSISSTPTGSIESLLPSTTYSIGASYVDASLNAFHVAPVSATTEASSSSDSSGDCASTNVALLSLGASVADVSSNYGGGSDSSTYGANNALDGSDSSQWSSNGDGNDAFLTIRLPSATDVEGVALWSRYMSSSSVIETYTVSDGSSGVVLATCDVPDSTQLYHCDVVASDVESLTFSVVASTGGNVGARAVEVYGCARDDDANESVGVCSNEECTTKACFEQCFAEQKDRTAKAECESVEDGTCAEACGTACPPSKEACKTKACYKYCWEKQKDRTAEAGCPSPEEDQSSERLLTVASNMQ